MKSVFTKIDETPIYNGFVISVFNARFSAPDGTVIDRDVVRHPGAVSVVPVMENGDVVMVRQFRAPLEATILEIPAGKRDVDGEPTHITAERELVEEIGYFPRQLTKLTELCHSPGFCNEVNHIYLAQDLEPRERYVDGPEEASMSIETFSLRDTYSLISQGTITDAKSMCGLMLAYHALYM